MKKKLIFIIITMLLVMTTVFTYIKTDDAVSAYCYTIISNTVQTRINNSIYEWTLANSKLFTDICKYSYSSSGEIASISINSFAVNTIRQEIEKCILVELSQLKEETFNMPIGNISGIKILSGTGPDLKIKIVPLSTVSCDTINSFESVGINQTLHSVCLIFAVCFNGAPPFASNSYEAEFSVTVCENIIIGEVPNVYLS